ncbi:MAG: hypothetical protein KAT05_15730 [Spirochaetes bacterium]|nr:hypothetical protein [Spirochaetota bacterium]
MNNENESMNWKDELESYLADSFIQVLIFIIVNLIFISSFTPEILDFFKNPLYDTITVKEIIAILTIIVFAFGILFFAGVAYRTKDKYVFKDFDILALKGKIIIVGASFICSIFIVVFVSTTIQQLFPKNEIVGVLLFTFFIFILFWIFLKLSKILNTKFMRLVTIYIIVVIISVTLTFIIEREYLLLNYLVIISLLIVYFGYLAEKYRNRTNNLTLKMLAYDESGYKRLEIRKNLELFDITKMDYRFKDLDGNEFIIPSIHVQEIIYEPIKNSETDTTKQDTSK